MCIAPAPNHRSSLLAKNSYRLPVTPATSARLPIIPATSARLPVTSATSARLPVIPATSASHPSNFSQAANHPSKPGCQSPQQHQPVTPATSARLPITPANQAASHPSNISQSSQQHQPVAPATSASLSQIHTHKIRLEKLKERLQCLACKLSTATEQYASGLSKKTLWASNGTSTTEFWAKLLGLKSCSNHRAFHQSTQNNMGISLKACETVTNGDGC